MTLPVPVQRTWTVGDIVTAAEMNANVRDAVNFLANMPMAVLYQNTGQAVAGGTTPVILSWDTEIIDSYGGHSNTVNNARYTAQVAGYHAVFGTAYFPNNSTGYRRLDIYVNGASYTPQWQDELIANSGGGTAAQVLGIVYLGVGDYVQLMATQTSGGSQTLPGGGSASMSLWWMHT
jgi:hypothetical protein